MRTCLQQGSSCYIVLIEKKYGWNFTTYCVLRNEAPFSDLTKKSHYGNWILVKVFIQNETHDQKHDSHTQILFGRRSSRDCTFCSDSIVIFHMTIIQSILCTPITLWFGCSTKKDRCKLPWTTRSAEKVGLPIFST